MMNQNEIKQLIESERDSATSKTVWSTILNKFKKLKGEQLKIALAGIERYAVNCEKVGVKIESAAISEIVDFQFLFQFLF